MYSPYPYALCIGVQDVVVDIPFWLVSTLYSDTLELSPASLGTTQQDQTVPSLLRIVVVASKAFKGATFAFAEQHQQEAFLQVFYTPSLLLILPQSFKALKQRTAHPDSTLWDFEFYFNPDRELRIQGEFSSPSWAYSLLKAPQSNGRS